ncbi:hypothetical protein [Alkalihalophilus marmarensis]|uniref:hypothetical protein n=1 Tax=Alkalihalophilus marmarensis TaxID=521377 RepID=UPI002DC03CFF|nr:hypothetical protein [Alkalihalophilus marmarensis]MEC2074196.1 hypothetical protein [Alkalihalophilus marmarensis]
MSQSKVADQTNQAMTSLQTPIRISFPFFQHAFGLHLEDIEAIGRVTPTEIDLMIILHKICNTNGVIRYTNRNQIYTRYKAYFTNPSSASQFYDAFQRFIEKGLVKESYCEDRDLYSYTLQHFLKEDGKPERFATIHQLVFGQAFQKLTLSARKLFFLVAMRQENKQQIIHMTLKGKKGLYTRLRKSLPVQIQSSMDELIKAGFFTYGYIQKEKGVYHQAVCCVHEDYHCKMTGAHLRDPLEPTIRYPRKVGFIKRLLDAKGIGELAGEIGAFIHLFKRIGNRVIRNMIRELAHYIKTTGQYPSIPDFIKKQTRRESERNIIDLAYEYDFDQYVTEDNDPIKREEAFHHFAVNLSRVINLKDMRKAFSKARKALKDYGTRIDEVYIDDYITYGPLGKEKEMGVIVQRAYQERIKPNSFKALVRKAEFFYAQGEFSLKECYDWLLAVIKTAKEEDKMQPRYQLSYHADEFIVKIWESPSFS